MLNRPWIPGDSWGGSPPLCNDAEIISLLTNRYVQLIEKTDYLLRALDSLFEKEVMPMEEYNLRRGLFKNQVKRIYYACRRFDEGLRGRMNAYEATTANGQAKTRGNGAARAKPSARPATEVLAAKIPSGGRKQKRQQSAAPGVAEVEIPGRMDDVAATMCATSNSVAGDPFH